VQRKEREYNSLIFGGEKKRQPARTFKKKWGEEKKKGNHGESINSPTGREKSKKSPDATKNRRGGGHFRTKKGGGELKIGWKKKGTSVSREDVTGETGKNSGQKREIREHTGEGGGGKKKKETPNI